MEFKEDEKNKKRIFAKYKVKEKWKPISDFQNKQIVIAFESKNKNEKNQK